MDNRLLVQQVATGDEEALMQLYRRFGRVVYSMAFHILQDAVEAEEVVQEVFFVLWRQASTYEPARGSLTTWLLTITRRRAIDLLRRREARPPGPPAFDPPRERDGKSHHSPADLDLQAALAALPKEQKQCLELIYFSGFTQREVAEELGISLGTVKGRVRLALEKLRYRLLISTRNE